MVRWISQNRGKVHKKSPVQSLVGTFLVSGKTTTTITTTTQTAFTGLSCVFNFHLATTIIKSKVYFLALSTPFQRMHLSSHSTCFLVIKLGQVPKHVRVFLVPLQIISRDKIFHPLLDCFNIRLHVPSHTILVTS